MEGFLKISPDTILRQYMDELVYVTPFTEIHIINKSMMKNHRFFLNFKPKNRWFSGRAESG